MADEPKHDVTLKNGRSFDFDLDSISYKEWRDSVNGVADLDTLLMKVTGLSEDELYALSLGDKKRLHEAFITKATSPLG
jgi:hypothetical protein